MRDPRRHRSCGCDHLPCARRAVERRQPRVSRRSPAPCRHQLGDRAQASARAQDAGGLRKRRREHLRRHELRSVGPPSSSLRRRLDSRCETHPRAPRSSSGRNRRPMTSRTRPLDNAISRVFFAGPEVAIDVEGDLGGITVKDRIVSASSLIAPVWRDGNTGAGEPLRRRCQPAVSGETVACPLTRREYAESTQFCGLRTGDYSADSNSNT